MGSLDGTTLPLEIFEGVHTVDNVYVLTVFNDIIPVIEMVINYPAPMGNYSYPGALARVFRNYGRVCNFDQGEYRESPTETTCLIYPNYCADPGCSSCLNDADGRPTFPVEGVCIPDELSVFGTIDTANPFKLRLYLNCGFHHIQRVKLVVEYNTRNTQLHTIRDDSSSAVPFPWGGVNVSEYLGVIYVNGYQRTPTPVSPGSPVVRFPTLQTTGSLPVERGCPNPNLSNSCLVYPVYNYDSVEIEIVNTTNGAYSYQAKQLQLCELQLYDYTDVPQLDAEIIRAAYVREIVDVNGFNHASTLRYPYQRYRERTLANFNNESIETLPRIPFIHNGHYPLFQGKVDQ